MWPLEKAIYPPSVENALRPNLLFSLDGRCVMYQTALENEFQNAAQWAVPPTVGPAFNQYRLT